MRGQSCPALYNPMDCSPPGFSVHGVFQAKLLKWVAISSSRASSCRGIEPTSPVSPLLAGRFFTTEPSGKPMNEVWTSVNNCTALTVTRGDLPGLRRLVVFTVSVDNVLSCRGMVSFHYSGTPVVGQGLLPSGH